MWPYIWVLEKILEFKNDYEDEIKNELKASPDFKRYL